MKRTTYIFLVLVWVAIGSSCSWEKEFQGEDPGKGKQTRTLIVELNNDGDEEKQEDIHTIRFIVFDNASAYPKLDRNEMVNINEAEKTATGFDVTLEVNENDDKMLVAIVNEPVSLTNTLAQIDHPWALESLMYDFADVLNSDHFTPKDANTGIPLTGVIRANTVYPEQGQAENNRIPMTIERAVARMDIYLEAKEEGASPGYRGEVAENDKTRVTLHNTYDESYLVMGNKDNGTRGNTTDPELNFGRIQKNVPVSELINKTWIASSNEQIDYSPVPGANNRLYVCSFYTPERTFAGDDDRLALSFDNVLKGSQITGTAGAVPITTVKDENNNISIFNEVRRNNAYRIVARVGKEGIETDFTAQVTDWNDIPVNADFDKDLYLSISRRAMAFPKKNASGALVLKTNNTVWSASYWADKKATVPLSDGWLSLSQESGTATDGSTLTVMAADNAVGSEQRTGYIKFSAGRMSLMAEVTQDENYGIAIFFAHSNVLTLDGGQTATFAVDKNDHTGGMLANMQGLMFKWGSLIGMGTTGGNATKVDVWFDKTGTTHTWDNATYAHGGYTEFRINAEFDPNYDAFATFNNGTGYNASAGVGDICRYISAMNWVEGDWRLPTSAEWELLFAQSDEMDYARYGVWGPEYLENANVADGKYRVKSGYWYGSGLDEHTNAEETVEEHRTIPPPGTIFMPASGYVSASDGKLLGVGNHAGYWSSRSRYNSSYGNGGQYAYHLRFDEQHNNDPAYLGFRATGFAVRCIMNEYELE